MQLADAARDLEEASGEGSNGMVLATRFAGPGRCLVELGRARDPIRLGVGGTEPGTEPHPQRGWDCRWLPPTPVRQFK